MADRKVLVVDEDAAALVRHAAALRDAGFDVDTARIPEECLERLPDFQPDLVVLDVSQKDGSGHDIARVLKSHPRYGGIPLVQIAAQLTTEQLVASLESAGEAVLQRPVDPRILVAHVRALLRLRRAERALQDQQAREMGEIVLRVPMEEHGAQDVNGPQPAGEWATLVGQYQALLEAALHERVYKTEGERQSRIRDLSDRLARLKAGPRDVILLHTTALRSLTRGVSRAREVAVVEEARLVVLELMGLVLSHYRRAALGRTAPDTAALEQP